jgi:hypothetical protein
MSGEVRAHEVVGRCESVVVVVRRCRGRMWCIVEGKDGEHREVRVGICCFSLSHAADQYAQTCAAIVQLISSSLHLTNSSLDEIVEI